jgi:hypothetical protein
LEKSFQRYKFFTTAPVAKPSVQTRFILEAMADQERGAKEDWGRMMETLEAVCARLKDVERAQQQLMVRSELAATVAERVAAERVQMSQKMEETEKLVEQLRLENRSKELGETPGAAVEGEQHHQPPVPPFNRPRQERREPLGGFHVSHPALRNKARCISYMRQEDNIYNNRVYRDKCHKTSEYLLHSGRLITK